jgi:N-carbamoylputrescine amidase
MLAAMRVLTAIDAVPESYARVPAPDRPARRPFRVGAVQQRWHPDPTEHEAALAEGIRAAAERGAQLVCLQELTLSPYFAITPDGVEAARERAEDIPDGPTTAFAARMAAETGAHVHASLYERPDDGDALGYNTAICVAPDGTVVARTRKLHIPVTAGYYEDRYFRPGPPGDEAFPVVGVGEAQLGFPTCWDQWFPELARAYSLAGAEVIVYPTAIGSEPDHPDFDTEPLWEKVIVANGIANGTFMSRSTGSGTSRRSPSTARRSSRTPTGASWSRRRAMSRPCWWPTSTSTSAATGSSCSPS